MTATRQDREHPAGPASYGPAVVSDPVPVDEHEAVEVVEGGESVGIPSLAGVLKGFGSALAQPGPVTRGADSSGRDWASIARGTDKHRPSPKDKRFTDPAWTMNPVFRRLGQGYLALREQLDRWSRTTRRPPRTGTTSSAPGSRWTR